jgi:two-component system chemotaxis response regulator CheB
MVQFSRHLQAVKEKSTSLRSQRRRRVLILDDSHSLRRAVAQHGLTLPGLKVVGHASDGFQALAALRKLRPHVLTLDIHMAKMGGIAVLKAIRYEGIRCQVMVLASGVDEVYGRKCTEFGAN